MGIVAEDVERTRSATDLVALVSEHVALRRVGTRWVGLCPFHSEKTGSFSVNAELGPVLLLRVPGPWRRHQLPAGDRAPRLRDGGRSPGFPCRDSSALRHGRAFRPGGQAFRSARRGHGACRRVVPPEASASRRMPGPARRYLRDRGYGSDTVKHFRLGWAPAGWDALVREAGVTEELLVEAGLAYRNQSGRLNDSFRERVLFPIFDIAGRPVGLGGRVLPGGSGPKYKNTSATALYDKSKVLYGLNWAKGAIVERGRVVVCEGYTDVIGLHRAGVTEAVATCGTALADGHVRLLTGFSRRIVLAYDADSAGQGAAEHFYDWERRFEAGISVVALPPGPTLPTSPRRTRAPAASCRRGQALPGFPPRAALRDGRPDATPRAERAPPRPAWR